MQDERITPERFECPSCSAGIGEPCRTQPGWTHVTRGMLADKANWQALMGEMHIESGWTVGR